jgi:hypothetical protein
MGSRCNTRNYFTTQEIHSLKPAHVGGPLVLITSGMKEKE